MIPKGEIQMAFGAKTLFYDNASWAPQENNPALCDYSGNDFLSGVCRDAWMQCRTEDRVHRELPRKIGRVCCEPA